MPTVIEELVIALSYEIDSKQLEAARAEAKKAAAEISQAFEKFSEDGQDAADEVGDANEDAAKRSSEVWTGALRRIGERITDFAVKGIGQFAEFAIQTFENTRELDAFAQSIGVSTEQLSALEKGFERARVPADNTREAIKTFQENLGELRRLGTGPALESLGTLGLELEDFTGLDAEGQVRLLAEAFAGLEDRAARTSVATELMGEDGRALLPALLQGASGVDALTEAAREAGQVLDQETIETTRELDRTLQDVKGELEGVALEILTAAAPALLEAAEGAAAFVEQNEEFIQQDIPAAIRAIADAFGVVAQAAVDATNAVGGFVQELSDADLRSRVETGRGLGRRGLELMPGGALISAFIDDDETSTDPAALGRVGERDARFLTAAGRSELQRERAAIASAQRGAADVAALAEANAARQAAEMRAGAIFARQRRGARTDAQNRAGGGGDSAELRQGRVDVQATGLSDEFSKLAQQFGASDRALAEAIEAAARSFARGASQSVARKAGLGTLGGLVGVDLNKLPNADPLLSEIFGVSGLPDAPLSELTQNRTPQVLTATINNNFTLSQSFQIDGAQRPDLIPEQVNDATRDLFENEVGRASKFAKVNFAR